MMDYYSEIDIGSMDLDEVIVLLQAYQKNPITLRGMKIGHNSNSGYTFIVDENYDTYMMNEGKLEQWYNCGNCGDEGFLEDFKDHKPNGDYCYHCKPWKYDKDEDEEEDEEE